jgi:CheY-like chemotaxis protein
MSVVPLTSESQVRHSCGELNPGDAVFCGGCGVDLSRGAACTACGRQGTAGARYCHGCGARLQPAAGGAPIADERVQALADEVTALRGEIADLLVLKEQLDGALKRMRQRAGGAAAGGSRPVAAAKPKPQEASPAAAVSPAVPESSADVPGAGASDGEAEPANVVPAATHVAVLHFEDRPDLQDVVQATVSRFRTASYHPESAIAEGVPAGRRLPVMNLLAGGDPLASLADPLVFEQPRAFTYATDGSRGFILGVAEFFPPPLDPAACANRILAGLPASPRVLVVSEAVLGAPELRAHLVRQGCTTSIAFDVRQALGLIPSVRPSLVLIDLNLPRGEGLRLAARIRAEDPNHYVRFAFLWQQQIETALFRQAVTRAIHDFQFSEEDLRRQLLQEFNPGGAAHIR